MSILKTSYLVSFLLSSACSPTVKEALPPIEERIMIKIIHDIYYLEAQFSDLNGHLKDSVIQIKFIEILDKYEVTEKQYFLSKAYYNNQEGALLQLEQGIQNSIRDSI